MTDELDPVELAAWGALLYMGYLLYQQSQSTPARAARANSSTPNSYGTATTSGAGSYGTTPQLSFGSAPIGTGNAPAAIAPASNNYGTGTQGQPGYGWPAGGTPAGLGTWLSYGQTGAGGTPQPVTITPRQGTPNSGSAPIGTGNAGTPNSTGTPNSGAPSQSGKFNGPFDVSGNGIAFIKNEEGLSLNRFLDAGHWAIGYGHDYPAGQIPPASISQAQADALLAQDLANVVGELNNAIGVPLTQNQFDALVSIGFNVGVGGIPSLLNAVNAGNDTLAAQLFGQYDHSQGRVLASLAARRAREAQLYLN